MTTHEPLKPRTGTAAGVPVKLGALMTITGVADRGCRGAQQPRRMI
jgi:hypothetical protein